MKNQEILDEAELLNGKEIIDKRTENPAKKAFIYWVIMFVIGYGMVYLEFRNLILEKDFKFYFSMITGIVIFCFIISCILEFFRFLIRKFKNKKSSSLILVDPLWFQIVESAFSIWILISILKIIQKIFFS